MIGVHFSNLAVGVSRWSRCAHPDVAGKYLMLFLIEHGVYVDPLTFSDGQLSYLRAVAEDARAFVKCNFPMSAAKNTHSHLVVNLVHSTHDTANQSGFSFRQRRRIQNGIVSIGDQP